MLLSLRSIAALFILGAVVSFGVIGTYFLGTTGHNFNQNMNIINAIYFTIITLSTVGYGDIVPITPIAKMFVVTLIVFGMGAFLTALTSISSDLASKRILSLTSRLATIEGEILKDHILLIGSGTVNLAMIEDLKKSKRKYVMIINDITIAEKLSEEGYKVSAINLLSEKEIQKFNPEKASKIIVDIRDPSDTIYITLILAKIAKDIPTIVIAHTEDLEMRLESIKTIKDIKIINPSKLVARNLIEQNI
jgi:voltage-gated potassium channel